MLANSALLSARRLLGGAALGALLSAGVVCTGIASANAQTTFHPLPMGQDDLRFEGEMDQASYQVYLSPSMVGSPLAFQVAPTSAISVMPEASWMHVHINGHALQPVRLGTDRATTLHQRMISPQMLQAGWNTVRLVADQRHRVDCTFPGTFELWSDINAASTGFLAQGDGRRAISSPADLLGMPRNDAGRMALHGVLFEGADENATQALGTAMAMLALAMELDAPLVSAGQAARQGGINVQLGNDGSVPAGQYRISGTLEGAMIVLGGVTPDHFTGAAESLAQALEAFQSAAPRPAHRAINGSDRFTLADLGLPSQEFSGRHFEKRFTLDLPVDYFASDVGRAEIRLAGGYAAGLAPRAELSVQVNGILAASIPLDGERGEVFSGRSLYIDLGHFRPGRNEVAIVADVSHGDDEACDITALTQANPRFLLLDETEISFPNFAQLGTLPRLAPGLSHQFGKRNGVTNLHVPHPDMNSISAALGLQVRLALDVGHADGIGMHFDAPREDASARNSNTIMVAALGDLPREVASVMDLPMQDMELAWTAPLMMDPLAADPIQTASIGVRTVLPSNQPLPPQIGSAPAGPAGREGWSADPVQQRLAVIRQEMHRSTITTGSVGSGAQAVATVGQPVPQMLDEETLRARWEESVQSTPEVLQSAAQLGGRLQAYVVGLMGEPRYAPDISADADLVIEQMASSPWTSGPLTLITASEPARLEAAMQTLSQPRYWHALDGSRAVFSQTDGQLDVSTGLADTQFVVTQPTSISNWRLVLAGYYSNNPILYTLAILLIAPGLGIVCGRAIRRSGQVQKEGEEAHA